MDWENHLEKNPIPKIEKTIKIKVKLPSETPFSHSTLKIRAKQFHAA